MSSIGVIGGADGPTRVFVSGPVWPWVVFGAAAVALLTRRDAPAHAFYQRNGFADAEWRAWMTRPCQEDL